MTSSTFNKAVDQIKAIPQKWKGHVLEFVRVLTGLPLDEADFDQKVTVKETYRDGTVELSESINRRDGQSVIVTFSEDSDEAEDVDDLAWSGLDEILENCQVSTRINDLAWSELDEILENCQVSTGIDDLAWSGLDEILENCQVSTGINDLAAQHDHYIHGTPKREV